MWRVLLVCAVMLAALGANEADTASSPKHRRMHGIHPSSLRRHHHHEHEHEHEHTAESLTKETHFVQASQDAGATASRTDNSNQESNDASSANSGGGGRVDDAAVIGGEDAQKDVTPSEPNRDLPLEPINGTEPIKPCNDTPPYDIVTIPTYDPNAHPLGLSQDEEVRFHELMSRFQDEVHNLHRSLRHRPDFEDLPVELKADFEELRDLYIVKMHNGSMGFKEFVAPNCPNQCSGHGNCKDVCLCDEGWVGADCGTFPKICAFDCQPRGAATGVCVFNDTCECSKGFTGSTCETIECNAMCTAPHGTCDPTTGECICAPGRMGENCDESFCAHDCMTPSPYLPLLWKHGKCEDSMCRCNLGWEGAGCETFKCSESNKCQNGGACVNSTCVCAEGFEDLDCSRMRCLNDCSAHGICNGIACDCMPGWLGDDCGTECSFTFKSVQMIDRPSGNFSGFVQLQQHGLMPPPGGSQASVSYFGKIYLWGGYTTNNNLSTDFWTYEHTSTSFSKIDVRGAKPPSRAHHTGASVNGQMWVYGGTQEIHDFSVPAPTGNATSPKPVYGDLWSFHFERQTWAPIGQDGEVAPGVYGHSMTLLDKDNFVLFGGVDTFQRWSRDIFSFNVQQRVWKNLTSLSWEKYYAQRELYEINNPYFPETTNGTNTTTAAGTGSGQPIPAHFMNLLASRARAIPIVSTSDNDNQQEAPHATPQRRMPGGYGNARLPRGLLRTNRRDGEGDDLVITRTIDPGDGEGVVSLVDLSSPYVVSAEEKYERGVWIQPDRSLWHTANLYRGALFVFGGLGYKNRPIDYCNATNGGQAFEDTGFVGTGCTPESCRIPKPLNDIWKYDFETNDWSALTHNPIDQAPLWVEFVFPFRDRCFIEEEEDTGSAKNFTNFVKPPARFGHSSLIISGKMYVFGGTNGVQLFNDIWEFNFEDVTWSLVEAKIPPPGSNVIFGPHVSFSAVQVVIDEMVCVMGNIKPGAPPTDTLMTTKVWTFNTKLLEWKAVNYSGWVADARSFAGMTAVDALLYLFGGRGTQLNAVVSYNDVWVFDPARHYWEYQFVSSADRPTRRSQHAFLRYDATSLVVYGGTDGVATLGDVWFFNILDNSWRMLQPEGEEPSGRVLCAAALLPTDTIPMLLIYGGSSTKDRLNDLWILNVKDSKWEFVDMDNPPARGGAAHISVGAKIMMLFGALIPPGKKDVQDVKEVWMLDFEESVWAPVKGGDGGPQARHWHSANIIGGEAIFLFGGFDGKKILDDVWWFSRSSGEWKGEDLSVAKHPTARQGATTAVMCGNIFLFGGEVPGFPQRDLWVFMTDSKKIRFPSVFGPMEDIKIQPTEASLSMPANLFTSEYTDPIVKWLWLAEKKELEDGPLFDSAPALRSRVHVVLSQNTSESVDMKEPLVSNTTGQVLKLEELALLPKTQFMVKAFSEKGYEMSSSPFYVTPVSPPMIDQMKDLTDNAGKDVDIIAHIVRGTRGGPLTVNWFDAETGDRVAPSEAITIENKERFSLTMHNATIGVHKFFVKASNEGCTEEITSNTVTVTIGPSDE